ncbi:hypothetical protein [uncultured Brevundimonas sp.]|uniref:hypothetical protein n=1 Tax=uncultured Brevundimonas sp. TaxID=213418 RepID=UPI002595B8A0|nr:hypothetical protein [uncultured Brevundimonas sp.]
MDENAHFKIVKEIETKQRPRLTPQTVGTVLQTMLDILNEESAPVSARDLAAEVAVRLGRTFSSDNDRFSFRSDIGRRLQVLKSKGLVRVQERGRRFFWFKP